MKNTTNHAIPLPVCLHGFPWSEQKTPSLQTIVSADPTELSNLIYCPPSWANHPGLISVPQTER